MNAVTARVELELPLTVNEGNIIRAAAARINAETWWLDYTERFLDGLRLAMNADAGATSWLVYRGGSHVALIKDGERILLVTEEREQTADEAEAEVESLINDPQTARVQAYLDTLPREEKFYGAAYAHALDTYTGSLDNDGLYSFAYEEAADRGVGLTFSVKLNIRRAILAARLGPKPEPLQTPPVAAPQAPQATTAPTIQPNDPVDMFVNQGVREGYVLAVLGDEYLVEYTMPKGTTSLQIFNRTVPNIIWKGKSYPNPTNGKSVSYKALPTRWLQAIVDAGTTWEGRAQGVYAAPGRYGYGGNHKTVPSAADLLAAKGRRKASSDVCEHGYAQGCRACNPDGGR